MERYRSGHNEAVLKTVCPQGRVGSNPTLSVWFWLSFRKLSSIYLYTDLSAGGALFSLLRKMICFLCDVIGDTKDLEKYPRG